MLVLLISQLALIIYVWVDHVQIQQSLEKIVQTIWDQRKTDALLMDTLQRSVSIFYTYFRNHLNHHL